MSALSPSPQLLCKIGSALVHAEEFASPDGHEFDSMALTALLRDSDIQDWLASMRALAMIPEKRKY